MFPLFLLTQIFSRFGFMQTGAVVVAAPDTAVEVQRMPSLVVLIHVFGPLVGDPPAGQLLFVQLFLICCCGKTVASCLCHDQSTEYVFFYPHPSWHQ